MAKVWWPREDCNLRKHQKIEKTKIVKVQKTQKKLSLSAVRLTQLFVFYIF